MSGTGPAPRPPRRTVHRRRGAPHLGHAGRGRVPLRGLGGRLRQGHRRGRRGALPGLLLLLLPVVPVEVPGELQRRQVVTPKGQRAARGSTTRGGASPRGPCPQPAVPTSSGETRADLRGPRPRSSAPRLQPRHRAGGPGWQGSDGGPRGLASGGLREPQGLHSHFKVQGSTPPSLPNHTNGPQQVGSRAVLKPWAQLAPRPPLHTIHRGAETTEVGLRPQKVNPAMTLD